MDSKIEYEVQIAPDDLPAGVSPAGVLKDAAQVMGHPA